jgi:hypothetical protein
MMHADPEQQIGLLKCVVSTSDKWNDEEASSDTDVLVEDEEELLISPPISPLRKEVAAAVEPPKMTLSKGEKMTFFLVDQPSKKSLSFTASQPSTKMDGMKWRMSFRNTTRHGKEWISAYLEIQDGPLHPFGWTKKINAKFSDIVGSNNTILRKAKNLEDDYSFDNDGWGYVDFISADSVRKSSTSKFKIEVEIEVVSEAILPVAELDLGAIFRKAVYTGREDVMERCLLEGVHGNEYDPDARENALHKAAQSRRKDDYKQSSHMVKLLVEKQCDINLVDLNGVTPLDAAVGKKRINFARALLEAGCMVTPAFGHETRNLVLTAVTNGDLKMLRLLLDYGSPSFLKDVKGDSWCALFEAADRGLVDCCRMLLENGAVEYRKYDDLSDTPLARLVNRAWERNRKETNTKKEANTKKTPRDTESDSAQESDGDDSEAEHADSEIRFEKAAPMESCYALALEMQSKYGYSLKECHFDPAKCKRVNQQLKLYSRKLKKQQELRPRRATQRAEQQGLEEAAKRQAEQLEAEEEAAAAQQIKKRTSNKAKKAAKTRKKAAEKAEAAGRAKQAARVAAQTAGAIAALAKTEREAEAKAEVETRRNERVEWTRQQTQQQQQQHQQRAGGVL